MINLLCTHVGIVVVKEQGGTRFQLADGECGAEFHHLIVLTVDECGHGKM